MGKINQDYDRLNGYQNKLKCDLYPSEHAKLRMNQRNISNRDIETIYRYGDLMVNGRGAEEYSLSAKKAAMLIQIKRKEIKELERAKNKKLVCDGQSLVTLYRF